MAEVHQVQNGKATMRVPEFLREPFEAAQARLEAFEEEAQKVFQDLVQKGKATRKDFSGLVQRLSKQDWTGDFKDRIERLREQGAVRAQEFRGRADNFRSEALTRLEELQARAVSFLGVASREQVEMLSRELDRIARRLGGKGERSRKVRKSIKHPSVEV